jgi:adenosine deaminase
VADLAPRQGIPLAGPVGELVVAPRDCGTLMTYLR